MTVVLSVCVQDVLDPGVPDPLLLVETHPLPASIAQQEEVHHTSGKKNLQTVLRCPFAPLLSLILLPAGVMCLQTILIVTRVPPSRIVFVTRLGPGA